MMGSWVSPELMFLLFLSVILTYVRSCEYPNELVAVRETPGTFNSPNYPNNYPHNSRCSWMITTQNSSDVIQIVTREMDLEKRFGSYGCIFDYVAAFDGPDVTSKKLGQWCGKTKRSYVSSSPIMYVLFQSDKTQNAKGFVIEFTAGPSGSFTVDEEEKGTSMMEMVGYVVFVLVLIAIAMVILRIILIRTKQCKCRNRSSSLNQRTRALFSRRTNTRHTNPRTPRGFSTNGSGSRSSLDIFTIPMPPPSYEEVVHGNAAFEDDAPPPYTAADFPTSPEDERNLDVSVRCVYDNEGFISTPAPPPSPPPSPPPPYEVLEASSNNSDNGSYSSCEDITSVNTNSSSTRASLSSQDGENVSSFVPVG